MSFECTLRVRMMSFDFPIASSYHFVSYFPICTFQELPPRIPQSSSDNRCRCISPYGTIQGHSFRTLVDVLILKGIGKNSNANFSGKSKSFPRDNIPDSSNGGEHAFSGNSECGVEEGFSRSKIFFYPVPSSVVVCESCANPNAYN